MGTKELFQDDFVICPSLVLPFFKFVWFSQALLCPCVNKGRRLFISTVNICPNWAGFKYFNSFMLSRESDSFRLSC